MRNCSIFDNPKVQQLNFLDEIRELYDLSNYGTAIVRDTLIHDIFIVGIASKEARCFNLSAKQRRADHSSMPAPGVKFLSLSPHLLFADITVNALQTTARHSWKCFGCGSTSWHPQSHCPAFKTVCHNCTKVGHYAKVCRQPQRSVDTIDTEDNSSVNLLVVNSIHLNAKKQTVSASINGKEIPSMLVDTGADISVPFSAVMSETCHSIPAVFCFSQGSWS